MSTLFDKISMKVAKNDSSKFDLSHDVCETIDMCVERPIVCREMVPNDKFNCNISHAFRFGSMVAPTFGRINVNYHAFFVPYRIIFKDWPHFWDGTKVSRQVTGSATINYQQASLPTITPFSIIQSLVRGAMFIPKMGTITLDSGAIGDLSWNSADLATACSQYRTSLASLQGCNNVHPEYPYRKKDLDNPSCLAYEVPCTDGFDFILPEKMIPLSGSFLTSAVYLGDGATYTSACRFIPDASDKSVSAGTYSAATESIDGKSSTTLSTSTSFRAFRLTPYGRHYLSMLRGLGYDINLFSAVGLYATGVYQTRKLNGKKYTYLRHGEYKSQTSTLSYANLKMSALPLLAWIKIYVDYLKNRKGSEISMWQCLFDETLDASKWLVRNASSLGRLVKVYYDTDYFTATLRSPMDYDGITNENIDWKCLTRSFASASTIETNTASVDDNPITGSNGYVLNGTNAKHMVALDGNLLNSVQAVFNYSLRNSLAGQRYQDRIYARFGIKPSYSRLDMAECINTQRVPISINEVMSTAETLAPDGSVTSNLGDYSGKCQQSQNFNADYSADEFGLFIVSYNITPKARYPYGINAEVMRSDRTMFYNPEFDALGTQSVSFAEMLPPYLDTRKDISPSASTFGYLPTYSFYKVGRDRNNGDFSRCSTCEELTPLSFSRINTAENVMRIDRVGLANNNNEEFLCATQDMTSYYNIFNDPDMDFDHIFSYLFVNLDAYRPMKPLFELQGLKGGQDVTIDAYGNKN